MVRLAKGADNPELAELVREYLHYHDDFVEEEEEVQFITLKIAEEPIDGAEGPCFMDDQVWVCRTTVVFL